MCGRFALGYPRSLLEERFHAPLPEEFRPQYNFAPGQEIAVFRRASGHLMRWGFVPPWAGSPADGTRPINARSETVFDKPLFREAARTGRCLVPTQGYYEWRAGDGGRQPYFIRDKEGDGLTVLAGISSRWQDKATGEVLDTVAVLTCAPGEAMARIHHRMPVILPEPAREAWLDPSSAPEEFALLLAASPADRLEIRPVSPRANDVRNRDASLLDRVDIHRQGTLPLVDFGLRR